MHLLKTTYINHKGQKIESGDIEGLFLNEHDLFNFDWNVQTRGNRIVGVDRKGVKEHNLPFVIVSATEERAYKYANDLFSICEADMQANKKGRLEVNGYRLDCFIKGQSYSNYANHTNSMKVAARVIRDSLWYKPLESIEFYGSEQENEESASADAGTTSTPWTGGDKGYYHGYPYDYPSMLKEYYFDNPEDVSLSWKAVIYGPATTIKFEIADHEYAVPGVTLNAGDRLEIVSKESLDEKTVIKYKANGTTENCFANRSTTSYLFEPIPAGVSMIQYEGIHWKLTPIVERSSPKWL